jgi:hypothetical protein
MAGRPLQDSERFPPEFSRFQAVLGGRMVSGRRPHLFDVDDRPLRGDPQPQIVVEQEVQAGLQASGFLERFAAHECRRLAEDLERKQVLQR